MSVKSNLFTVNSLTSSSWSASSPLFIDNSGVITTTGTIADTSLATITTAGKVANSATSADTTGTDNKIVARDSSGVMSIGTLTCSAQDVMIATAAGPQATSSGVGATITGWTISQNLGNSPISESSGTFTIQKAGIYKIITSTTFDASGTGFRQLFINITSSLTTETSVVVMTSAFSSYQWQRNNTTIEKLAVGDTIHITAVQNAGTLNISNSTIQILRLC